MKLKKFTDTQAVKHLIRKKQASWEHRRKTGEKHHVLAYLYPDNRFTNAKIWLELPQAAVDKALAKQEKLGFHTDDLPTLDQAIASYRLGKATEAQLVRFYYDGTDPDQKRHRWYAEFAVNGNTCRYNADHILALEYAAGQVKETRVTDTGATVTTKRTNIDRWVVYGGLGNDTLEAWNGHCIGGTMALHSREEKL